MHYYFYSDLKDCNIVAGEAEAFFKDAVNDVDELISYGKLNGNYHTLDNPPSDVVKKLLFGTKKGHIYRFETKNKLSESKVKLLISTLIMNIMGNVQIIPASKFKEPEIYKEFLNKLLARTKQSYNRVIADDLDTKYKFTGNNTSFALQLKVSRFNEDWWQRQSKGLTFKTNWMHYYIHYEVDNFLIHHEALNALNALQEKSEGK
ncbi:hypothetical protein XaC1_414 [Xanthomonas phage XaC1]|nr:hypothetical protein XaC1_414 [Xanthomonas phage XaC1]